MSELSRLYLYGRCIGQNVNTPRYTASNSRAIKGNRSTCLLYFNLLMQILFQTQALVTLSGYSVANLLHRKSQTCLMRGTLPRWQVADGSMSILLSGQQSFVTGMTDKCDEGFERKTTCYIIIYILKDTILQLKPIVFVVEVRRRYSLCNTPPCLHNSCFKGYIFPI